MTYIVEMSQEMADNLALINERYYFDLFEPIREDEEQEFDFRNALSEFAKNYSQAVVNDNYVLNDEERESAYNHNADRCN